MGTFQICAHATFRMLSNLYFEALLTKVGQSRTRYLVMEAKKGEKKIDGPYPELHTHPTVPRQPISHGLGAAQWKSKEKGT
jgi:hypothetical protein